MFLKNSSNYNTDQVDMTNICLSNSLLSEYAEMLGFGLPHDFCSTHFSFLPPWPLTPASFVIKKEKSVWPALLYLLNRSRTLVRSSTFISEWDSCLNVLSLLSFCVVNKWPFTSSYVVSDCCLCGFSTQDTFYDLLASGCFKLYFPTSFSRVQIFVSFILYSFVFLAPLASQIIFCMYLVDHCSF